MVPRGLRSSHPGVQPWPALGAFVGPALLTAAGCTELLEFDEFRDATTAPSATGGQGGQGGAVTPGGGGASGGVAGSGGMAGSGGERPAAVAWIGQLAGMANSIVNGVAFDGSGYVVAGGDYNEGVTYHLDGAPADSSPPESLGQQDALVLRLDPEGEQQWFQVYGAAGPQIGLGVGVGPDDQIHLTGGTRGSVLFGGVTQTVPDGDQGGYLVSLSSAGVPATASFLFMTAHHDAPILESWDVDVAPNHQRWLAGTYLGQLLVGAESTPIGSLPSRPALGAFAVTSGPVGSQLVGIDGGESGDLGAQRAWDVAAIDTESALVVGENWGTIEASDGSRAVWLPDGEDPFAALLTADPAGVEHVVGLPCVGSGVARAVAAHSDGSVSLVGWFDSQLDVLGSPLESYDFGRDAFVARIRLLGASWTTDWALSFGQEGDQSARDVAVDRAGNSFVVGSYHGTIDLNGRLVTSAGESDGFLLALRDDGSYWFDVTFAGAGIVEPAAVASFGNPATRVVVAGTFDDAMELRVSGSDVLRSVASGGGRDGFVVAFDLSAPAR